jgi:hypothetical protein
MRVAERNVPKQIFQALYSEISCDDSRTVLGEAMVLLGIRFSAVENSRSTLRSPSD